MAREQDFHIVVFTDTFFETNGVSTYYKTLLDWCRETEGMRVTVVCPERADLVNEALPSQVIPVRPSIGIPNPFYSDLPLGYFSRPALEKILRGIKGPKIVHVATSGALGKAGAAAARGIGLPLVGCYHTDLPLYGRMYGGSVGGRFGAWLGNRMALFFEKRTFNRCRAMCVSSLSAARTVRGFFPDEPVIIPIPVDLGRFRPGVSRDDCFRRKYGSEGRALVVVVGRVAKEKNLDLVCEMLADDDRIDLVFVGDGPYASELKNRWNARVTGFLQGDDLLAAFQQADVLVQLSQSETYGLALVEAMACGLPAIVLRSQGFVESLEPGCGVEILEHEELSTLADRCVSLATNRDLHKERSAQVRSLAVQLSVDSVFPKLRDFHRTHVQFDPVRTKSNGRTRDHARNGGLRVPS